MEPTLRSLCPKAMTDYLEFMVGVDTANQLRSYYERDQRSKKWWHRDFYVLLETSPVNAWICFNDLFRLGKLKDYTEPMSLLDFKFSVAIGHLTLWLNYPFRESKVACFDRLSRWMDEGVISVGSHDCIFFYSGPSYQYPDLAPLPVDRIREHNPFTVTGLDFTGPIPVHNKGEKVTAYILLFTCGVIGAIHLEVVDALIAGSFIKALRRFTGHHPIPRLIYSDNSSTFVNASSILVKFFKHPQSQEELGAKRIIWKFIPKAALWYGGCWEQLISLTKTALHKMVGRTILSYINSRLS
jgi:hypothetical protein